MRFFFVSPFEAPENTSKMVKSYRCFTDVLLVLKLYWFSTEVAFGAEVLLIVSALWILLDIGVDLQETAWIHTPIPMFHSCHWLR